MYLKVSERVSPKFIKIPKKCFIKPSYNNDREKNINGEMNYELQEKGFNLFFKLGNTNTALTVHRVLGQKSNTFTTEFLCDGYTVSRAHSQLCIDPGVSPSRKKH